MPTSDLYKRLKKLVLTLKIDDRLILEIIFADYVHKNQLSEERKSSELTFLTDSKGSHDPNDHQNSNEAHAIQLP